jgi:hypothetical protein
MVIALHNIAVEHEYLKQVGQLTLLILLLFVVSVSSHALQESKRFCIICPGHGAHHEQKDGHGFLAGCGQGKPNPPLGFVTLCRYLIPWKSRRSERIKSSVALGLSKQQWFLSNLQGVFLFQLLVYLSMNFSKLGFSLTAALKLKLNSKVLQHLTCLRSVKPNRLLEEG